MEKLSTSHKGSHGRSAVRTDMGLSWGLGLALLPGSTVKKLALTAMAPTVKAAVLSPPRALEPATLELLTCGCGPMFLLHTSEH